MASAISVIAFLLVGVGTGLACVGLVLPSWLEIRMPSGEGKGAVLYTMGLWQLSSGNGSIVHSFVLPPADFEDPIVWLLNVEAIWMRPVEALYCLGVFGGFLALVMGIMYLCNPLFRMCAPVSMTVMVITASFICMVASGIIFSMKVSMSQTFRIAGDFSWAFYFATAGAGCFIISLIFYVELLFCTKKPKFDRLEEEDEEKEQNKSNDKNHINHN